MYHQSQNPFREKAKAQVCRLRFHLRLILYLVGLCGLRLLTQPQIFWNKPQFISSRRLRQGDADWMIFLRRRTNVRREGKIIQSKNRFSYITKKTPAHHRRFHNPFFFYYFRFLRSALADAVDPKFFGTHLKSPPAGDRAQGDADWTIFSRRRTDVRREGKIVQSKNRFS